LRRFFNPFAIFRRNQRASYRVFEQQKHNLQAKKPRATLWKYLSKTQSPETMASDLVKKYSGKTERLKLSLPNGAAGIRGIFQTLPEAGNAGIFKRGNESNQL